MVPPRDKPTTSPEGTADKRSGRVAFDDRGNSVWEWQIHTGVYSRDVNTQKVRKLDLDELSLEDTAVQRRVEEPVQPASRPSFNKAKAGGGFNPYDNAPTTEGAGHDPYNRARVAAERIHGRPAPAVPPKKPATDLRKLSSWIKLKRALGKE